MREMRRTELRAPNASLARIALLVGLVALISCGGDDTTLLQPDAGTFQTWCFDPSRANPADNCQPINQGSSQWNALQNKRSYWGNVYQGARTSTCSQLLHHFDRIQAHFMFGSQVPAGAWSYSNWVTDWNELNFDPYYVNGPSSHITWWHELYHHYYYSTSGDPQSEAERQEMEAWADHYANVCYNQLPEGPGY